MHRKTTRLLLACLLVIAAAAWVQSSVSAATGPEPGEAPSQRATVKAVAATAPDIPLRDYDFQSEQRLFELANQARQTAGAPALDLDSGLSQAARIHAQAMVDAHQLSHQFDGEAALPQRLAAMTRLQLDQEGENVAFDSNADDGHRHLMLSPPHRANLLNPAYNVVGLGVVRSGERMYIVEDFAHSLPNYSASEMKQRIVVAVNLARRQASQPALQQGGAAVDEAACSMAHAGKLGTDPVRELAERHTVLTFTSLRPDILPDGATRAITRPNLHTFSVGACYSRSETYPTGVYWVVLSLD